MLIQEILKAVLDLVLVLERLRSSARSIEFVCVLLFECVGITGAGLGCSSSGLGVGKADLRRVGVELGGCAKGRLRFGKRWAGWRCRIGIIRCRGGGFGDGRGGGHA